jgi:curved DNA-binding protein CbpA
MTDDLYAALGVAPTASTDEVRAAYRRRARKAHPDAGGSPDEFTAITRAKHILVDPRRRERYDRDGVTDDAPDNREAAAVQTVVQAVNAVVEEYARNGIDPGSRDVGADARTSIRDFIRRVETAQEKGRAAARKKRAIAKRFKTKKRGGVNRIAQAFLADAATIERAADADEDKKAVALRALEILDEHAYDFEPEAMTTLNRFGGFPPSATGLWR